VALVLRESNIVKYAFVSGKLTPDRDNAGHRERLRERFRKKELAGFIDYEVIEYLLTLAHVRGDCKAIAKSAIKRFGTVRGVLDASIRDLKTIGGIGDVSACTIKFARALALYYLDERVDLEATILGNSQTVVDVLRAEMRDLSRECFWVVYLDAQNRKRTFEMLFEGTLTSSAVYPREVFKRALENNASSVIFAHNHPSGCIDPSENDRQITRDLVLAANFMDVRVLDHIIVGANEHYSFADHGLMQEYRKQAMDFQESRRRLS
jgi:DNA repair protein RadC